MNGFVEWVGKWKEGIEVGYEVGMEEAVKVDLDLVFLVLFKGGNSWLPLRGHLDQLFLVGLVNGFLFPSPFLANSWAPQSCYLCFYPYQLICSILVPNSTKCSIEQFLSSAVGFFFFFGHMPASSFDRLMFLKVGGDGGEAENSLF